MQYFTFMRAIQISFSYDANQLKRLSVESDSRVYFDRIDTNVFFKERDIWSRAIERYSTTENSTTLALILLRYNNQSGLLLCS